MPVADRDAMFAYMSYSCQKGECERCHSGPEHGQRSPLRMGEDPPLAPKCTHGCHDAPPPGGGEGARPQCGSTGRHDLTKHYPRGRFA